MEQFCSDVESHLSTIKIVMLLAAQTSRLFWRLGTRWGSIFYPSGRLNRKKGYIKYERNGVFVIISTQKHKSGPKNDGSWTCNAVFLFLGSGFIQTLFWGEICLLGETAWLTGWIQSVRGGTAAKCFKLHAGSCWTNSIIPNIKQSLHSKRSQRGEIHFLIPCQKLSQQKKKRKLVFPWFCVGWQLAQISILLSLSVSRCLSLSLPHHWHLFLPLPPTKALNHFDGGQASS